MLIYGDPKSQYLEAKYVRGEGVVVLVSHEYTASATATHMRDKVLATIPEVVWLAMADEIRGGGGAAVPATTVRPPPTDARQAEARN